MFDVLERQLPIKTPLSHAEPLHPVSETSSQMKRPAIWFSHTADAPATVAAVAAEGAAFDLTVKAYSWSG
jgi:hypothetical protein